MANINGNCLNFNALYYEFQASVLKENDISSYIEMVNWKFGRSSSIILSVVAMAHASLNVTIGADKLSFSSPSICGSLMI